jgi:hypothetical protein
VVGYGPFSLCVIHKEGLYPSSGGIIRLTMMMIHCLFPFLEDIIINTSLDYFSISRRPSGQVEWRFAQDGWRELDASSRRSSEMVSNWRGLCPAVDCSGLMMMMMDYSIGLTYEIWMLCTPFIVYTRSRTLECKAASTLLTFPRTLAGNHNKDDVMCYAEICSGPCSVQSILNIV